MSGQCGRAEAGVGAAHALQQWRTVRRACCGKCRCRALRGGCSCVVLKRTVLERGSVPRLLREPASGLLLGNTARTHATLDLERFS